jgi:phospholipase A1
MEGIVFIPGIFGSELNYNNNNGSSEIWPPGLFDLGGYTQISELSDPTQVSVGDIIDYIGLPIFPVYSTIQSDLTDICNKINSSNSGPYLAVPYDWRADLFTAARYLEQQVTQWAAGSGLTSITFFAHSMGGLVVRLLLESVIPAMAPAQRPAWVSITQRVVFACTPHLGAPEALALALGLAGDETLTPAQCKQLSGNPAFPAAYELLPSPARNLLFDTTTGAWIPYDRNDVVAQLGLSAPNIAASNLVRGGLNVATRIPAGIEYFFMYGTGLETDESIDVNGLTTSGATIVQQDDGDGTVPTWSISEAANQASPPIPTWSGPGEHLQLLSTDAFRQELYRYFGLGTSAPMLRSAVETPAAGISVHCNKHQYAPGASVHILLIPDAPTETLAGTLQIRRVVAAKGAEDKWTYNISNAPVGAKTIKIEGGPVKTHSVHMTAPEIPGAYQLAFAGDGATHLSVENGGGWFFVSNDKELPSRGLIRRPKP